MSRINLPETIKISCDAIDGPEWREVPGVKLPGGVFAITRYDGFLSLTHIPTGRSIVKRVKAAPARRAAKRFHALQIDWQSIKFEDIRQLPEDVLSACKAIIYEAQNS